MSEYFVSNDVATKVTSVNASKEESHMNHKNNFNKRPIKYLYWRTKVNSEESPITLNYDNLLVMVCH